MRVLIFCWLALMPAACAPAGQALSSIDERPFQCPAGVQTLTERDDGSPYRTVWLGAEPGDPYSCRSMSGKGVERDRLFGRWDMNSETIGGTTEEKAGHRSALTAFLSGQTGQTSFILRGRTGEQTSQIWRRTGLEMLTIGGREVPTVQVHSSFVYAGDGRQYFTDLWYAPGYRLFVKSRAFGMPRFNWTVVRINETGDPAPAS